MKHATQTWLEKLHEVMTKGELVNPRGYTTREILASTSTFNMNRPEVCIPERKLGRKFLFAEAAWILSGDNRVSSISPFSQEISKFSDDGVTFFGAYGPKVVDQLHYVVQALVADKDTRQAVMTIWRESPRATKDVPCTVAVQWFIRDNRLYCIDTMRSSDLWLGWPYDVFNFTMLSVAIAIRYRQLTGETLELGDLTLVAGSQHIYERNWDKVVAIINSYIPDGVHQFSFDVCTATNIEAFDSQDDFVAWLWSKANAVG